MLAINRSDDITLSNDISGTGTLAQIGAGTTILTGTNTSSGSTIIASGVLQVGNGGTTGSWAPATSSTRRHWCSIAAAR